MWIKKHLDCKTALNKTFFVAGCTEFRFAGTLSRCFPEDQRRSGGNTYKQEVVFFAQIQFLFSTKSRIVSSYPLTKWKLLQRPTEAHVALWHHRLKINLDTWGISIHICLLSSFMKIALNIASFIKLSLDHWTFPLSMPLEFILMPFAVLNSIYSVSPLGLCCCVSSSSYCWLLKRTCCNNEA